MTKNFENGSLRRPASWQRKVSRRHVLIVLGLLAAFNVIFYFLAVYPLDAREEHELANQPHCPRLPRCPDYIGLSYLQPGG